MIAIQNDLVTFDLHDRKNLRMTGVILTLQLAAYLDAWWKLGLWNGLHKIFITQTKSVFRLEFKCRQKACNLPFQRLFDFRKRIAITAMQINHRFTAFFEQSALAIGYLVTQSNRRIFFNFHK